MKEKKLDYYECIDVIVASRKLAYLLEMNKDNLSEIRKKLGFVLQNSDNQMFMPTVFEDMMFAPLNYGMSKEDAARKVDLILERLNLSYLKNRYNHKISGGEKNKDTLKRSMFRVV